MAAAGISIATLLRMNGAGAADGPALELYARYGAQLFRFCRRLAPDADAAEDAVQATVLEATRLLGEGFRPEFESAWLFSLAQRNATDGRARSTRTRLSALPDELREPLALRLEGRTYAEIAEALGVARGAIELRVLRGRIAAQARRSSRLGDLASLGGALKALLAGGATVPATVAAVGAVAVVPRLAHRDSRPAQPAPASVARTAERAAPAAVASGSSADAVRIDRARVAKRPAGAAAGTHHSARARLRPAAPAPAPASEGAAPATQAPSVAQPSAATPQAPAPQAPSQSAPAPAPASAAPVAPVAGPDPVASAPALPPVSEPAPALPAAPDPVTTVTTVDDVVAAAPTQDVAPTLPAAPPLPETPLPKLP